MGYLPNPAARGLITGRTSTIGLIVPDLENPFFASVTKGVQSRARVAGYCVIVADSDEDPSQEEVLARNMSKRVDGIVLCSPRAPDSVIAQLALECRLVLVNRACADIPAVAINNLMGIRQAMGHLRALGHTARSHTSADLPPRGRTQPGSPAWRSSPRSIPTWIWWISDRSSPMSQAASQRPTS